MNHRATALLALFLPGVTASSVVDAAAADAVAAGAVAADARIHVRADRVAHRVTRHMVGACIEDVNHEIYGGIYSQMLFGESFQEPAPSPSLRGWKAHGGEWVPRGAEVLAGAGDGPKLVADLPPFAGRQSQGIAFEGGEGEIGVENRGLNRRGLHVVGGRPYEGYLWVRAAGAASLRIAIESGDGGAVLAEETVDLPAFDIHARGDRSGGWRRLDFTLTPSATADGARFSVGLRKPGSIALGHAFLQPGEWGRFRGLTVRRDVVEGLLAQGLTVLRYGGSMVNAPEYRWKKMVGPRDRRPPYRGTWYPWSTNGWGIVDFLDLCEAAGFLAIPAFNMGETPEDIADFVEYANGPPETGWGKRRVEDGHPRPYGLRHIQLGNEERVDGEYYRKFAALAGAIWAADPDIIIVVGDFVYSRPIEDPFRITGAASRIATLEAHRRILELAKASDREVWFDIHIWSEDPRNVAEARVVPTYVEALRRISGGGEAQSRTGRSRRGSPWRGSARRRAPRGCSSSPASSAPSTRPGSRGASLPASSRGRTGSPAARPRTPFRPAPSRS